MNIEKKAVILLSIGFLLLLLGSMPLNGYVFFQFKPREFHADPFTGSVMHLLLGVVPWLLGIILIAIGSCKIMPILIIGLGGIGGGSFIALPALIQAQELTSYFGFLAIVGAGVVLCVLIRLCVNLTSRWV